MNRTPGIVEPPRELVERAQQGDTDALDRLVRELAPLCYRWCLARTGDPADAEDLRQTVLTAVVRKLGDFRHDARLTSWLFRLVQNGAIDRERSRERRRDRVEKHGALDPVRSHEPPRDVVDRSRLLERVRESFMDLTTRQREVFELSELGGLNSSEVAETLGISESTVRVTLLRARRTIRREILRTDPELVEAFLS